MSVTLTKPPLPLPSQRAISGFQYFFTARLNLFPSTQIQYIFFYCARFQLIPRSSMGDLAQNRNVLKLLTDVPGSNSSPRPRYLFP